MDYSQFIPAFAMNETMRKGGTHWECLPSAFRVYKGKASILYSYACLEVSSVVDVSTLDLEADCCFLFFPLKRGNNVLVITSAYLSTIIDSGQLNLAKLDKSQILYSDRYDTGPYDIPNESSCEVQEGKELVHQCGGNCITPG